MIPGGVGGSGKTFRAKDWEDMVSARYMHEDLPSFKQICPAFQRHVKHQLFMGGKDAGATMHFHTHAYNMLFFGYVFSFGSIDHISWYI